MTEDSSVPLHCKVGDLSFLFAINVVIDALVTYRPEFQGEIASRLSAKIDEIKATPGLKDVDLALADILQALEKPNRALQRAPAADTA